MVFYFNANNHNSQLEYTQKYKVQNQSNYTLTAEAVGKEEGCVIRILNIIVPFIVLHSWKF